MIAANDLGRSLAARGIKLVYGGGNCGLVGCISSAAYVSGTIVLGIILQMLSKKKNFGETLGDELQVFLSMKRWQACCTLLMFLLHCLEG